MKSRQKIQFSLFVRETVSNLNHTYRVYNQAKMKLDYDEDDHVADFHDSDLDDIQDDPYHSYGSPP